jgi:ech hydrogenase subunit D
MGSSAASGPLSSSDGRNPTALLARAREYHASGSRLAVINATSVMPTEELPDGAFDISWSFSRNGALEHVRDRVLPGEEVPSISDIFVGAFLYENEMRELFGINVTGIAVDLKGQLYQTAERVPFAPSAIRRRLEAAKPAPKPVPVPAAPSAAPAAGGKEVPA